ncbi:MAG: PBP1A family penicillin-binding protein [Syntrophomonadaceae bacterium]|nr:PBP1A family penicillin-binding protein [Syntrophomonadaceae bacterium]
MAETPTPAPSTPPKPRRKIKIGRILLSLFLLSCIAILAAVSAYAAKALPVFNPQQLVGANTTMLYDREGNVFNSLHGVENRVDVNLEQVPPALIQAFIATEDKEFYNHHGINVKGIARAVLRNFQVGDMTGQGASTITQQLARSSFLSNDKNWERKIKEMFLAFKIEATYSKDEILEMYLNKIYFGAGAYGVQAASHTFFDKDVSELTLPEASLLAGLVQSPSYYNPFSNMDSAKNRQKQVLYSMAASGYFDPQSSVDAYESPIELAKAKEVQISHGFYTDAVIDEAIAILSQNQEYNGSDSVIYTAGLRIFTNLDLSLQDYAEEYSKKASNFPGGIKDGPQVQVGMAIVDSSNGGVLAIMGGRQYEQVRGFNRATSAYRQPGSSIKPLTVYAPALEQGYMPYTVLNDAPVSYNTANGVWKPANYDGVYRGLITMRTAVKYSVNTYAVQMEDQLGARYGFDMGRALGLPLIDTPGHNDLNLAALGLGGLTKGVTPVQMAGAYAVFSNGGIFNQPHFINRIENMSGVTIYEFQPAGQRVISPETAWLMNSMLQTVVESGTGTRAKIPNVPTGGKTGTSEEFTDIWFCGVTPRFAAAVWMGFDEQKYKMVNVAGGGAPALMVKAMMQKAHQGGSAGSWPMPAGVEKITVCSESGQKPGYLCPAVTEYALKSKAPTQVCSSSHTINICRQTGLRATKYCPDPIGITSVQLDQEGKPTTIIPTDYCPVHTSEAPAKPTTNVVKICTDPRNEGKLYLARPGCSAKYIYEIVLPAGQTLPSCPIDSHQR